MIERIMLSDPQAMLVVDGEALFRPLRLSAWRREQGSAAAVRDALNSPGTLRLQAVEYDPHGAFGAATDCLGREVLRLDLAALWQMMSNRQRSQFHLELSIQRRRGWQPKRLKAWLRSFLRPDDAGRVLDHLTMLHRLANGETLTKEAVGMERLFDLTGSVSDRRPLHLMH
ncbi:hypothetical protein VPH46_04745 [Sphingomonas sp. MJ1 (PH-R8)]|uniref:hypothetical protein n=1 Tax=Sphingomonas sp. MJ1 (PH-R8) TaxID=3112950 RepID=UPI003A893555